MHGRDKSPHSKDVLDLPGHSVDVGRGTMWFDPVNNLVAGQHRLRQARCGMIEAADGRLARIVLRPWAKLVSRVGLQTVGRWTHSRWPGDRLRLYYHQPRRMPNYLAVSYVISAAQTCWATVHCALSTLDELARLKQIDALLCEVSNRRISRRLLEREGWEPLRPDDGNRLYVRRFYGQYPAPPVGSAADAFPPVAFDANLPPVR